MLHNILITNKWINLYNKGMITIILNKSLEIIISNNNLKSSLF